MIKRIQVGKNKRVLDTDKIEIDGLAVRNDNDVDVLRFEFDEFVDGQATMLTDIRGEDGLLAPFILEKNSEDKFYEIRVTKELLVNPILTIQLQIVDGEKVWNSKQACLLVHNSLNIGEGKMPSGIDNWLEQAGNKLNEADQKIQEIEKTIKEFKEKDPTIPQHVKNITEEQISNWDEGGNVDLSDYYTKEEIDNKGYITELPEIEVEQKQANYNQNDSTQPDYIKNRPFYEGVTTNEIVILEKGDRDFPLTNDEMMFYTYTFTEEEKNIMNSLTSGTLKLTVNSEYSQEKYIADVQQSVVANGPESFNVTLGDGNTVRFRLKGDSLYITLADETRYNVELVCITETSSIVKIDEKFLPDTVATKDYVDQAIAEAIANLNL